ncbi:MAG: CPBP family intramembrane metalloprotease [Anaerolineales bacterium]|nr:CPBP family intramembrane metalloprotease [Anaerolineales bacterium]
MDGTWNRLSRGLWSVFFITPEGRIGLFWRIAAGLFFFLIVAGLSQSALLRADENPLFSETAKGALYLAAAAGGMLAATALARRLLDRRPWRGIGLTRVDRGLPLLLLGWTAGCALIALLFAVECSFGWMRIEGFGSAEAGWATALDKLAGAALVSLAVGMTEETAFRGYLFQNLGEEFPLWFAVPAAGCLFALLHGNAGWGYFLGVSLIGAFFCLTRLGSGSLWFVIGFHGAWNWAQSKVFGLGMSGRADPFSLLRIRETGPEVFLGRGAEIEGGLTAIGLIAAALICAWFYARRRHPGLGWGTRLSGDGNPSFHGLRNKADGAAASSAPNPCAPPPGGGGQGQMRSGTGPDAFSQPHHR